MRGVYETHSIFCCMSGWLWGKSSRAMGGGRGGGISSSFSSLRGGMGGAGSLGGGITVSSSICTGRTPVRGREDGL